MNNFKNSNNKVGFFKRIWHGLKSRRFWFTLLPVALAVLGFSAWYTGRNATTDTATTEATASPSSNLVPSLLNGVLVSPDIANKRVVATMIENTPEARPQAGLSSADVVYEDTVEGGITRFMALFQQTQPDKVGPVRSARSYYVNWLAEYDGIYMHAGGSPAGLAAISKNSTKDYPDISNDSYFRIPKAGLASEHTLYASVAKVFQYATTDKKWSTTKDFPSWQFKDPIATPTTTGTVSVNFTTSTYQADWVFDPTANIYARKLAGVAHNDQVTGEQIKASTIVVMTVQRSANAPYAGTGKESEWNQTTIGSGAVSVFEDGTRVDGTWKKASVTDRTRFYDTAGKEISLNRGKIWIEVIPQTGSVTFTPTAVATPTPTPAT